MSEMPSHVRVPSDEFVDVIALASATPGEPYRLQNLGANEIIVIFSATQPAVEDRLTKGHLVGVGKDVSFESEDEVWCCVARVATSGAFSDVQLSSEV